MAKTTGQKLKILYLLKILRDQTDESHPLTVNELISRLAVYGVTAERKTIYDDIEALRQYGVDIVMTKGKAYGYYIGAREFELPELKLLADAVQSSKFITEKKSRELIKKLQGLVSAHEALKLRRQVFMQDRVKNMNESIYYSVDTLHQAIAGGNKITFKYFDYNIYKERVFRRDGGRYTVSPAALSWNDEHYYLIGYSEDREGLSHYRVDRMSNVRILNEKTDARAGAPGDFNPAVYAKRVFGMYGGEEAEVRLRFSNSMASAVIDRFGKDAAMIYDDDEHFIVKARVALSPVFFAWLFQFGELCEVMAPESLRESLAAQAEGFLARLRQD